MSSKKIKWYKIGEPNEFLVAEGIVIEMSMPEKHFCITRSKDKYYAFQSKCPHAGAKFAQGWLNDNNCIVCPLHRYAFNLENGYNKEGFGLVRYPIKEDDNGIWIGLPEQLW